MEACLLCDPRRDCRATLLPRDGRVYLSSDERGSGVIALYIRPVIVI